MPTPRVLVPVTLRRSATGFNEDWPRPKRSRGHAVRDGRVRARETSSHLHSKVFAWDSRCVSLSEEEPMTRTLRPRWRLAWARRCLGSDDDPRGPHDRFAEVDRNARTAQARPVSEQPRGLTESPRRSRERDAERLLARRPTEGRTPRRLAAAERRLGLDAAPRLTRDHRPLSPPTGHAAAPQRCSRTRLAVPRRVVDVIARLIEAILPRRTSIAKAVRPRGRRAHPGA